MEIINKSSLHILLVSMVFFSCTGVKPFVRNVNKPLIVKLGTIDCDLVESTPISFREKLYRFEYIRQGYWDNKTNDSYFRFVNHETGKPTKSFAKGFHLGSAFVHNNKVIVTAVDIWDGDQIHIFVSDDLINWKNWPALDLPGFGLFNSSMTHNGKEYVLMFEIGRPEERAGVRFTANFAKSKDLMKWDVLPSDHSYAKDRYTAPHSLRFLEGYYYNFYLEAHNGYEMRVVRSRDLIKWESSPFNPVLKASLEDKKILNGSLKNEFLQKIAEAENINNSDIDFCEFNGKLVINYSWGNQRGEEFLAEATFNGTLRQFLKGWFP